MILIFGASKPGTFEVGYWQKYIDAEGKQDEEWWYADHNLTLEEATKLLNINKSMFPEFPWTIKRYGSLQVVS